MGFIEDKRAQIRTEVQARQSLRDEAVAEHEVREFHLQRRKLATTIRQDSGVGFLVKALGEILMEDMVPVLKYTDGTVKIGRRGKSKGCDYDLNPDLLLEIKYPNRSLTDPDGLLDVAVWDSEYLRHESRLEGTWDEARSKFLAVETRPDGDIVFYSSGLSRTIQEQVWRTNPKVLEEALEMAFNNPGSHNYRCNYDYSPYGLPHGGRQTYGGFQQ